MIVAAMGIYMFAALIFAPATTKDDGSYAQLILNYGCLLNPVSLYLLIGSIFLYFMCAGINNSLQKIGYKGAVKEIFFRSFDYKQAPQWLILLNSLSFVLFMVFLLVRLSYLWNHCE